MHHFQVAALVLALALVLSCVPLVHAEYSIDDRDSRIAYYGGRAWELHADSDGYMGTTTDNACFTAQACYFTISFAGSGIQLVRYNIHSIPIPVLATVTLDGAAQTGISIPDDQTVIVYNLQGFPYGDHVLRVDLLSWTSTETSHFRLDRAIVNDTRAVVTTTASTTSTSTTPRSGSTPQSSQSTPTPGSSTARVAKKKVPIGPVIGGAIAGVAALSLALFLIICLRRRSRGGKGGPMVEKIVSQQHPSSRFDSRTAPLFDPTPPVAVANIPPARPFPPEIRHNTENEHGHLPPTTIMNTWSPPAANSLAALPVVTPFPPPPLTTFVPSQPIPQKLMMPEPVSPSSVYPPTLRESQAVSMIGSDADETSISRSISSASAFLPRLGRPLREDEVKAAADLLKQGVPPSDVTRILEAMQRGDDGATSFSHASTSGWGEKPSEAHTVTSSTPAGPAEPGPSRSQIQADPSAPPPYEARF